MQSLFLRLKNTYSLAVWSKDKTWLKLFSPLIQADCCLFMIQIYNDLRCHIEHV